MYYIYKERERNRERCEQIVVINTRDILLQLGSHLNYFQDLHTETYSFQQVHMYLEYIQVSVPIGTWKCNLPPF